MTARCGARRSGLRLWLLIAPGLIGLIVGLGGLALSRAPMIPLVDALTVSSLGDKSGDYGRVHVWGSVGFAAAVFVVGGLMDGWSDAPMGLAAALLVATAVLTWRLPSGPFAAPRAGCST